MGHNQPPCLFGKTALPPFFNTFIKYMLIPTISSHAAHLSMDIWIFEEYIIFLNLWKYLQILQIPQISSKCFLRYFLTWLKCNFDLPVFFYTHLSLHSRSVPKRVVLLRQGSCPSPTAQRKICLCFSKLCLGWVQFRVTFSHFSKILFYFLIMFQ